MTDLYKLVADGETVCTSSRLDLLMRQLCFGASLFPEHNRMIVSQITGEVIVDYDPEAKDVTELWHFSDNVKYVI